MPNATTGLLSGTAGTAGTIYSPYAVTVTAADATHSASQSFTWTVTPHVVVIAPPGQSNATLDSVTLPITAGDSDADTLSYSASGLPAGLSINSATGIISGTISATADSASPYTSTVTVSDGSYSTSETFSWIVSHVFVVNPGNQGNTTGDVVSLPVSARDRDGDTLTYTATGLPTGLSMNSSSGLISGTIANTADAGSAYSVTVTAADATKSNTQSFTWSISKHIAFADTLDQNNADGDAGSLAIAAVDPDNDTVTYSASGLPPGLAINTSTGLISGTIGTTADSASPYAVTITASDGTHTGSQSFNWIVTHVGVSNPGPLFSNDGAVISLPIQGRDVDGDTLTYSAAGLPSGLTINSTTGVISGTISSTAHTASPYNVTVTAADATHTATQAFTWTVSHIRLGVIADHTNTEGDAVSLQVSGTDTDGDVLTYSASILPAGLSLNAGTGLISGTIAAGAATSSPYTITVAATDGTLSSSQAFSWTVNPYVALTTPANHTNLEGASVSLQIQATDAGSHALTYSADGLPPGLNINASTGLVSGTITAGDSASSPYGVSISATDGTYTSTASFSWTITHSNDQNPSLTNPGKQGNHESDWVSLQLAASEPDGDPLSYSAVGLPDGLTIDPSSGLISGTIADSAAATGAYNVTVTITDPSGGSASQSFPWMVNDATLAAQGVAVTGTEGTPIPGLTVATFTDPDVMSSADDFRATINWGDGNSSAGDIIGAAGSFAVTGSNTYSRPGSYPASVTIVDSEGSAAIASGTASIAAATVSVTALTVNAIAGVALSTTVATFTDANVNDPASSYAVTVQWGDGNTSSGTVTGSLGAFFVTSSNTYLVTGTYTVTVTVTDKDLTSASSTATANVGDVFAGAAGGLTAATFTNVSGGTPSNSTATITWGDGNSGSGVVTGSLGRLTVTGNHVYTQTGSYAVSVNVTSTGGSQTASGTVSISAAPLTLYTHSGNSPTSLTVNNLALAVLTDANAADIAAGFTGTINWADGTGAASATITGSSGLFRATASHTFPSSGYWPFTLLLGPTGGAPRLGAVGTDLIRANPPKLDGPAVVPGLSRYTYTLSADPKRYKVMTWDVDAGLRPAVDGNIATSSDKTQGTITFKNVVAYGNIQVSVFEVATQKTTVVKFAVTVIQVTITTPDPTADKNAIPPIIKDFFRAGETFVKGQPLALNDDAAYTIDGQAFPKSPLAGVRSGVWSKEDKQYNRILPPGLTGWAKLTLKGPRVNGVDNSGVDHIAGGFVQRITVTAGNDRGTYPTTPAKVLSHILEGNANILDIPNGRQDIPYYNKFRPYSFSGVVSQIGVFVDNPKAYMPKTYMNVNVQRITLIEDFMLYIDLGTTDATGIDFKEAKADKKWTFNGNGTFKLAEDDKWTWQTNGAKVDPPNKWEPITAVTLEARDGPFGLDFMQNTYTSLVRR